MGIIINDNRPEKEFNIYTFSNYKKNDVIRTFINCMNSGDVEGSVSWCIELLSSGRLKDIWDCFLLLLGKYIRIGNPKLGLYISKRFGQFKEIIINGYNGCELDIRNNDDMRKLLCEITLVFCFSPKKPPLLMITINKKNDFSFDKLSHQLKATNMEWYKKIMVEDDPNEIILAINEFMYNFNQKNLLLCCYWIDWIIEFDAMCRKQKKPINIVNRNNGIVDQKFVRDPIWLIWEVLLTHADATKTKQDIVKSLLSLFCLKYNFAQKKKRKYLLYMGVELLTENVDTNILIIHNGDKIKAVLSQLDKFYRVIKKYEVAPDIAIETQTNLQKSIDKMKLINLI